MDVILVICDILIPLVMIICGLIMAKHPPKKPNSFVGYRTEMSMKNDDTWFFANRLCGKIWTKAGIWAAVISIGAIAALYFTPDNIAAIVSIVIILAQLVLVMGTIAPVERRLKEVFDKNGIRREAEEYGQKGA